MSHQGGARFRHDTGRRFFNVLVSCNRAATAAVTTTAPSAVTVQGNSPCAVWAVYAWPPVASFTRGKACKLHTCSRRRPIVHRPGRRQEVCSSLLASGRRAYVSNRELGATSKRPSSAPPILAGLEEKLRSDARKNSIVRRSRHIETQGFVNMFREFMLEKSKNHVIYNLARELGIPVLQIPHLAQSFFDAVRKNKIATLNIGLMEMFTYHNNSEHSLATLITPHWLDFLCPHLSAKDRNRVDRTRKLADMTYPADEYIQARELDRKVIMHVGPTNSGKTYQALQRMYQAKSGLYCGPLRLLAHEIYHKCNSKGIACHLITGEEVKAVEGAQHVSCTVEMAPASRKFEVAVIDEIQLIGDAGRGWAWTKALLGVRATEVHLCGEESAVPLVEKICRLLSEKLVVKRYKRLTPLEVDTSTFKGDIKNVRPGDCVVAFRKTDIFGIRKKIEVQTGLKCAVVYGGLPAEIRAMQANYFNDPADEHRILVASDAVGLGLNLNIRRMIFNSMKKYHMNVLVDVSPSLIKQIAGRAGRFNTEFSAGIVTTMRLEDIDALELAMKSPIKAVERAVLMPSWSQIEIFASQFPRSLFSEILRLFHTWSRSSGELFVVSDMTDNIRIAELIDDLPNMSTRERYLLTCAPVNLRSEFLAALFRTMAMLYSESKRCHLSEITSNYLTISPKNYDEFEQLQFIHQAIMLYSWLSYRIPVTYCTPREEILVQKARCEFLIDTFLKAGEHCNIYEEKAKPTTET